MSADSDTSSNVLKNSEIAKINLAKNKSFLFQKIFDEGPEALLVLSIDIPRFTIVAASDAYLQATRTKREEILGKGVFEVFPDNPDEPEVKSVEFATESFTRVIKERRVDVMGIREHDIRRPEAEGGGFEVRYWNPTNYPVFDENGQVIYIIHQLKDVTALEEEKRGQMERKRITLKLEDSRSAAILLMKEALEFRRKTEVINKSLKKEIVDRKKAEDALKESMEKYRVLFDSIDEGYCVIKVIFNNNGKPINYRFLDINPAFENQTGLANTKGKLVLDLVPTQEQHWFDIFGKVAKTGEPIRFTNEAKGLNRYYDVYAFPVGEGKIRNVGVLFRDITQRKKAEDLLQKSEKQKADILESITDGFVAIDKQWRYTQVNAAGANALRKTQQELLGQNIWDVWKDAPSKFREELERSAKEQVTTHFEVYYPQHFSLWFECRCYPTDDGLAIFFTDVTERKKAEQELIQSLEREHLLAEVIRKASVGAGISYPDGKIGLINQAFEKITGYSQEELQKINWDITLTVPEYIDLEKEKLAQLHDSKKPVRYEKEYIRKDGSRVPVELTVQPFMDSNGDVTHYFSFIMDITERKKTEKELDQYRTHLEELVKERTQKIKESEQSYQELYESFGEAFIAIDWELTVIHWNKAAERVTKVLAKDALGKKVYEVLPEMMSVDFTPYFEALQQKKPARFMMNTVSRETGRPSIFEISTYPSTQGIIIIVEDKTKEEEIKRLSAIGQTAGMVGHDIRNPLQAMIGDVYLAKSDLDSIPAGLEKDNIKESLNGIEKNIEYVDKIVQDLQDYARPLKPTAKETDLEKVFNHVLSRKAIPENIHISCVVESNAKMLVVDPDLLKRIFANLISNAVQAMPNGGKLTVQAGKKSGDVMITVKDTGVGIPAEVKGMMFTPMFTTKSKGQGFGLAVVKRLTEALGGTVSFESEVGKGTKFIVRLPPPKS
jgi:PAS domain S-box-containing protein